MRKPLTFALTFTASQLFLAASACAGAFNFQVPTDWTVGAAGSTYQEWEASEVMPFASVNSLPTASNVNPAISSLSKMSVQSPGFVASSGGYYSYSESIPTYGIFANVYNHGGSFGSGGEYSTGCGTRVIFQTASTTNPDSDMSVITDSIEFLNLDNSPFPAERIPQLIGTTELFRQEVDTPGFGVAEQLELLFEYYLPEYSGDFKIRFTNVVHSSFQELRVDTLLVEEENAVPGDFNGDGDVDGRDFLIWQRGESPDPLSADDLDDWQTNYGVGELSALRLPPSALIIPEPTSLLVVIFGIIMGLNCRFMSTGDPR